MRSSRYSAAVEDAAAEETAAVEEALAVEEAPLPPQAAMVRTIARAIRATRIFFILNFPFAFGNAGQGQPRRYFPEFCSGRPLRLPLWPPVPITVLSLGLNYYKNAPKIFTFSLRLARNL